MTHPRWLECTACGKTFPIGPMLSGCDCGGPLEVRYDPAAADQSLVRSWLSARDESLWQYAPLLPLTDPAHAITMGEGQTALHPCEALKRKYGHDGIFLKNETINPTWSHKDRYHTVAMSMARAFGFSRAVTASTGNHGISAAAYAARAGMACVVFFAAETSPAMWHLAGLYGAQAVVTSFDGRTPLVKDVAGRPGWYPATGFGFRGPADPFGIEGYKTIAFELIRQMGGAPDAVLVPVGGGNLLYGIWKGFREAKEVGLAPRTPRMVACHAAGANILERALALGGDDVPPLPDAFSIATSTREKTAGRYALRALRESGGRAVSVEEDEIMAAVRMLGEEGVCAETASALSVACAGRLLREGVIAPDERMACIITSSGVKWPELLPEVSRPPVRMAPGDTRRLEALLARFT
ncbi:MAG: pyridoxal-phosphate dependent enzyme [Armatimonadetes bacterium]|nr:pyridoxal-phosphate dependent enzyme [Armatimonadota bacterium]